MTANYQAGGQVLISGKWYTLEDCFGCLYIGGEHGDGGALPLILVEKFIQDYKPPVPREWISSHDWWQWSMPQTDGTRKSPTRDAVNQLLRERYGEPPQ